MVFPLQLGFTDYEQIYTKKKTRSQRFLEEMEITVPWEAFLALSLREFHYAATSDWSSHPCRPLQRALGLLNGIGVMGFDELDQSKRRQDRLYL